uniref:GNAT family N-acetyltransferase n=1 Tax=Cephaloticoccus sp. TaxID=1985742 RepID=UPI00404B0AA7
MEIRIDNLKDGLVIRLLEEHRREMFQYSPPDTVHALDAAALRKPDRTIWSAWINGKLAGCGALKELDVTHGEIKSMRTARTHLRQGVAAGLLTHILAIAKRRGYSRISLETGTPEAFAPARRLYEKFGFQPCAPFADYKAGPFSVCMTKTL